MVIFDVVGVVMFKVGMVIMVVCCNGVFYFVVVGKLMIIMDLWGVVIIEFLLVNCVMLKLLMC